MADIIEYTTITFDSKGIGGNAFVTPIKIRLETNEVQYKAETSIRNCEFNVIPDSITGEVSQDLIETENMAGEQYYRFDFGNGVVYRAQVPNVGLIVFYDLPNLERSAYNRDYPFATYPICN
jgi:hypothetical protein